MNKYRAILAVTFGAALALGLLGCGRAESSNSSSADGSGGGGARSAIEREAEKFAMAEVAKHCVKRPDGWVTLLITGSPFAPDHVIRQYRDIAVEGVESNNLSESDKMNGFEWAGEVSFKKQPAREAGDRGIAFDGVVNININRQRGQWTQWGDFTPQTMQVQKVKGNWQVHQDTTLLHGSIPTDADFAKAGVR